MLASTRALLFSSDAAEKHPRDLMVSDINGGGVKRVAEVLFRSGGAVVTGQVFLRFYFFAPRCVLDFITETAEAEVSRRVVRYESSNAFSMCVFCRVCIAGSRRMWFRNPIFCG